MENKNKEYTFYSNEMHCKACVFLTESELKECAGVSHVKSNLKTKTVVVSGNFVETTQEELLEKFSHILKPHGYTLSLKKKLEGGGWSDFRVALPFAFLFLLFFFFLQKIGLLQFVKPGGTSYSTAFFVGIVASLSSCMAVVGGLLLSLSATFSKSGEKIKPQLLFHFGRILSFFVLGGVIGALGSAFILSPLMTFILNFLIGLVMLILGINLLAIFPWASKLQPTMPKFISHSAFSISKLNYIFMPLLAGIATFFLPCGFTQSMQLFTLSTGSFFAGGFTMFAFALGTFPALAVVSFTSLRMQPKTARIFFKTAGIIVIAFASINILNSLVVLGVLPPFFNL